LILVAVTPPAFLASVLGLVAALPIGRLEYRVGAAVALALVPILLAFRSSAALERRRVRGFLRAPVAIAMLVAGYAAIVGALHEWRGLRPPHLVSTADHLWRAFVLGEDLAPLGVIEPQPPLRKIYDRPLAPFDAVERDVARATRSADDSGYPSIEVWDVETGALRHRFTGDRAGVTFVRFIDERRVVAERGGGRVSILDAEAGGPVREIVPPTPLERTTVLTATAAHAMILAGYPLGKDTLEIHAYDIASGRPLASMTGEAFGVSSDFSRIITVEKQTKGIALVTRHVPTGQRETGVPVASLTTVKGKRISAVEHVEVIGGGRRALVFTGEETHLFDLATGKAIALELATSKLFPHGVSPGGAAYFHRRTDASDPRATGLYRLAGGEKLVELETRGQPPTATFTPDGRLVLVDSAVFSTLDGKLRGGQRQALYTLVRDQWFIPTLDGTAVLEPRGDTLVLRSLDTQVRRGVVPRRGDEQGALSRNGKLYAVRARHSYAEDGAILARLAAWRPPTN
jgi:hypothetical protein